MSSIRDLLSELIQYEMDDNVEIFLSTDTEEGFDIFEFDIEYCNNSPYSTDNSVHFILDTRGEHILVNKLKYEDMEDRIEELEEQLNALKGGSYDG